LIAVLAKLAPPVLSSLDLLFKRRSDLLAQDQTLLSNLVLAQQVLTNTNPADAAGVLWCNGRIAKLRQSIDEAEAARDANEAAIVLATEEQEKRERGQACKRQLLQSLQQSDDGGDSDSEG
jgi:hypothetical protein